MRFEIDVSGDYENPNVIVNSMTFEIITFNDRPVRVSDRVPQYVYTKFDDDDIAKLDCLRVAECIKTDIVKLSRNHLSIDIDAIVRTRIKDVEKEIARVIRGRDGAINYKSVYVDGKKKE